MVTLITCTSGRRERLQGLVEQVRDALAVATVTAEFILVDNSAGGIDIPADHDVRLVRAPWPGLSRARQVGCTFARGDVIVFVDDDVRFDPDWVNRMVAPILDGRADIVAAPIELSGDLSAAGAPQLIREWFAENRRSPEVRLVGAGMAFRRDVLRYSAWDPQLGAGPNSSGYGEEQLFEYMARSFGARLAYAEGDPVIHEPDAARLSPQRLLEEAARKGRSEAYIAHHWLGDTRRFRFRVIVRSARARRAARRIGAEFDERALEAAGAVRSASFARAMLQLRHEPRRYLPRPGGVRER